MEENSIVTEEELNSFLNNLELKFIAQKLKIENVDKSIITLLKIVKNLQQENKQLEDLLHKANDEVISYTNCCIDLKEKIDKATEYINKNILVGFNEVGFKSDIVAGIVVNDLLQILGDKENE